MGNTDHENTNDSFPGFVSREAAEGRVGVGTLDFIHDLLGIDFPCADGTILEGGYDND